MWPDNSVAVPDALNPVIRRAVADGQVFDVLDKTGAVGAVILPVEFYERLKSAAIVNRVVEAAGEKP